MLRIRVKMGPQRTSHQINHSNNKEWTCCFGLHVHTATIMIGLWHLFLNILALSLLAVIVRDPQMMEELDTVSYGSVDTNAPILPTPLSKVDTPYAYRDPSITYFSSRRYHSVDMGGLVCICMIAITLMMIYGTIKGKPSHLLPFFCLQLFDFAITTLTVAGYLCYLQTMHRIIAVSHRLPWRGKLLELSPEELVVVVLVMFVIIVFLKAYAIGIVWRCYKYLTLRQQHMRTLLPCVLPDIAGGSNFAAEERSYSTLLPNYDEAIAQYMKQAPPPSYQVAMSNYQSDAVETPTHEQANGDDLEIIDNNNDIPNNNNTVHVNANTRAMRRNDALGGLEDADIEIIDAGNDVVAPPPAYNDGAIGNGNELQVSPIRGGININIPGQVVHINSQESQA